MIASNTFQTKILLLQCTRHWPPCDLDKPHLPQKLPLLFRWLDWIPARFGLEDLKSFPGIANTRNVDGLKKRKVGAWLVEPSGGLESSSSSDGQTAKKRKKGLVLYFKGRSGHRGQRSRIRMYEKLTRDPLGMHCVAFDGPADSEEEASERNVLVTAYAVWSVLTKPPYAFDRSSIVIWGSTFGCCSAANLCLYLMRQGNPPAALILESPSTSFPKLLASRFEYLGVQIQSRIEELAKTNLFHRFDLEKRIRSICSFNLNVPLLIISPQHGWAMPAAHAQRLADLASAHAASSKQVQLLSLPITRSELVSDDNFLDATSAFLNQALIDAKQSTFPRNLSVEFGGSPATWASDQTADDHLFENENVDVPFGL